MISVFGGRNEVLSFALVIEAYMPSQASSLRNLSLTFDSLGPLRGRPARQNLVELSDTLFDWRATDIELFYMRYLQIRGLSGQLSDERLIPRRLQRPWVAGPGGGGLGIGGWTDRPGANHHWPEIAVPLELHPSFDVASGKSQMIWCDVYIPKALTPGLYTGQLVLQLGPRAAGTVPISLEVRNFTLPDVPSSRTMVPIEAGEVLRRYIGQNWVNCMVENDDRFRRLWERHWQLAWRHRVQLVDASFDACVQWRLNNGLLQGDPAVILNQPPLMAVLRLNGSSFSAARNYSGPGQDVGLNIYPIGLYGSWSTQSWDRNVSGSQIGMAAGFAFHLNLWEEWFRNSGRPISDVERFIYLIDEPTNLSQVDQWAAECQDIKGPGAAVPTMVTLSLLDAVKQTPLLKITCSSIAFADIAAWKAALVAKQRLGMKLWLYNGGRPGQGMTNTEGESADWRSIPWALWKHGVNLYFYWMSTYYRNYQAGEGDIPLFEQAKTFGRYARNDSSTGEAGWMYGNGDGILLYPGTDLVFTADSYGVWGPFASLRLKQWRRGLQDVEYLELYRSRCGEAAATALVQEAMPAVLWEVGNPNWFPDISWNQSWDSWERIRWRLFQGIEGTCGAGTTSQPTTSTTPQPSRTTLQSFSTSAIGHESANFTSTTTLFPSSSAASSRTWDTIVLIATVTCTSACRCLQVLYSSS